MFFGFPGIWVAQFYPVVTKQLKEWPARGQLDWLSLLLLTEHILGTLIRAGVWVILPRFFLPHLMHHMC